MSDKIKHTANADNVQFLSKKIFELFKIIETDFDVEISIADVLCALCYVLTRIYKVEGVSIENVLSNIVGMSQKYDDFDDSNGFENHNEQNKQQHFGGVNEKVEELPRDAS